MACYRDITDSLSLLPFEAFRKNYDKLFESCIDPSILAEKLFAAKLITESTYQDVTDERNGWGAHRKLEHLLKPCMAAIKIDGKNLFLFLSILRKIGVITTTTLAENIMRDYIGKLVCTIVNAVTGSGKYITLLCGLVH